jgi:predicted acyl esterase
MRAEHTWPIDRTLWVPYYLDASNFELSIESEISPTQVTYLNNEDGVTFKTKPFDQDIEFTGPIALKLWASSAACDIDFFIVLRCFDTNEQEVFFTGAHESVPLAVGWLRGSHRKLDMDKSKPYRPYHTHDQIEQLESGSIYPFEIEILPSSLIFPKGYQLAVTILGKDFIVQKPGRILHTHPEDRSNDRFGETSTIYTGGDYASYLLMPVIPI